ncbi:MAG: arginine decarboxylase, partial [Gammaproteobacteria bacterium]|nr:arginine decarboxylase [Gammaproteobacteria bacterium]
MPSCALNDVFSTARDLQAAASAPGSVRPLARRALIVDDEIADPSVYGQAIRRLVGELENRQIEPLISTDAADAAARFGSDPGIDAILIDWNLDGQHASTRGLIERVRALYPELPVFLLSDEESALAIPSEVMSSVDGFIRVLEDTPGFIGGRIQVAMERYRSDMLPPMFKALLEFSQTYSYSWHTPGHTGGTAFLRSPAGRAFHAFFGEALLRADLSTSVEALGSLLEHSGAIGEGERHAARVFGAHRTYFVTNGSSTSNRVILMASVTRDQVVLCDRNCHKSIEQAVTLTGARPTYLMPTRNGYGIIGPIPPSRLQPEAIRRDVANNSLSASTPDQIPVHAVITNSTYDGLCYKVSRIEALLGDVVDRLHFDEAWYGYARFNPLYRERFAMHGDAARHGADQPTVFATQSTHKLLAALSQASMIHIRDGRRPIPHARFNEAYMMHASTSPLYPMIASLDISAAMMAGPGGTELTDIAIREAVAFRCALARRHAEHRAKDDWFFAPWQPETFTDSETGRRLVFHEAPPERLATDPGAWVLAPGDTWHGFEGLEDDYCMLDPIKVSILTPGASPGGGLADHGIPAILVSAYLVERGIVAEKTADFTILFLFS